MGAGMGGMGGMGAMNGMGGVPSANAFLSAASGKFGGSDAVELQRRAAMVGLGGAATGLGGMASGAGPNADTLRYFQLMQQAKLGGPGQGGADMTRLLQQGGSGQGPSSPNQASAGNPGLPAGAGAGGDLPF